MPAWHTAAKCGKAARQKLRHATSICGCCVGLAAACRLMLRRLKIRSANCWSHQKKQCGIWWVRGFKMVSEFGHLRYLYPPSRLKLSLLLTIKLLSSPKLKEPVQVQLCMNDRATLCVSVHFCTHFFATNSPVPHIRRIQIFWRSASHYHILRIDLVRSSVPSLFCAYLFVNLFHEYIAYSVTSYLSSLRPPVTPVSIAIFGSHPSPVRDVPFARTSVPSEYQPRSILLSAARTSTS